MKNFFSVFYLMFILKKIVISKYLLKKFGGSVILEQVINKIGFFVNTPFHYYLYEDTINSLLKKGFNCDLIINDFLQYSEEWKEMYFENISFLQSIDRYDIEAYPCSLLMQHNIKYICVVSPYYFKELSHISVYNVRMMYGAVFGSEKETFTFSYWNVFYDTILNYGLYDYNRTNIYNSGVIVGNPRFDRFFTKELSAEKIKQEYGINSNKKTILYAPTYGEHSSIDEWLDKLIAIKDKYNVIVKLHHGTAYLNKEKNRREKIYKNFNHVYDDKVNTLQFIAIADLVLTDTSGVIYEALLAGKKTALLNTNKANQYKSYNNNARILREIIPSWNSDCVLDKNIENLLSEKIQTSSSVEELLSDLFAFRDGQSSERAANAIIETVTHPKENILRKDLKQRLQL